MQETHPLGISVDTWRNIVSLLALISPVAIGATLWYLSKVFVKKEEYKEEHEQDRKEYDATIERARVVYKDIGDRVAAIATQSQTAIGRLELMERTLQQQAKENTDLNIKVGQNSGEIRAVRDAQAAAELRHVNMMNEIRLKLTELSTKMDERLPANHKGGLRG